MSDALELWPKDVTEKARRFAHARHNAINHKRKYTGEPYTNHLDTVADIVRKNGGTPYMIAAAYLHDTLENTKTTAKELIYHFPIEVVALVIELTDVYTKAAFPHLNRAARKALENARLAKITSNAKTIKLADMEDNGKDISVNDPDFSRVYVHEKQRLLDLWNLS